MKLIVLVALGFGGYLPQGQTDSAAIIRAQIAAL
jgi:hypothetical protein